MGNLTSVLVVLWLGQAQPSASLPMVTIEKGTYSSSDEPRQVVVRTLDEWTKLSRDLGFGQHPVPDFERNMVVGVCLGSRPTAGYSVEIVSIQQEAGSLLVRYRETRPPRDAVLAQVITAPCHFVAVPRSGGPGSDVSSVRFEKVD
jgi:PrcB C-terminal